MADGIQLEIVSPERQVLSVQANAVTVPGEEGYFTVMGAHAPLMTTLKPGFVTVVIGSETSIYFVRAGFAEVTPEGLTLLAEEARPISEFNRDEITTALTEAIASLTAAQSAEERSAQQLIVSSLENLLVEAQQVSVSA